MMNSSQKIFNKIINLTKVKKGIFKINSKDIKKGDIFVALKGNKFHGNRFIEDALNNKAKKIITDKFIPGYGSKIILVDNCIETLKNIGNYKRLSYRGKVIAVTGSVGKTSVKEQINHFLGLNFKTYSSIKSYNNNLGVNLSLANLDLNSEIAIFEIGTSNFGEIKSLTKLVKPNISVITNIAPTHLMNFKNIRNIEKEKSEIINSKHNTELQDVIIPFELSKKKLFIDKTKNCNSFTFSKKKGGDAYIKKLLNVKNEKFSVEAKIFKKIINYNLFLKGEHHAINSLISLLIFNILDINFANFVKNAISLPNLSGRGRLHNLTINKKKIKIIDESYNASPLSMRETIKYFNNYPLKNNRKFLILGDMLELGNKEISFHKDLKKYIKFNSYYQVITCGVLIKNLHKKCAHINNILYFENMSKLYNHLINNIYNNDIILAKCSNATSVNLFVKKLMNFKSKNRN